MKTTYLFTMVRGNALVVLFRSGFNLKMYRDSKIRILLPWSRIVMLSIFTCMSQSGSIHTTLRGTVPGPFHAQYSSLLFKVFLQKCSH